MKEHDERLPFGDVARFIDGEVALIPDGSPEATAGSSGAVFMDATFGGPVPLAAAVTYGRSLVKLHDRVKSWRSSLPSPDWPDHAAPEPVITGRATVTRFDLEASGDGGTSPRLLLAHAETDAANQIAEAVTLVFGGAPAELHALGDRLSASLPLPYRLSREARSSLPIPPRSLALQVVGKSAHGGYPHRGHNPVPATLELLTVAMERGWVDPNADSVASFSVDLRLTPEMAMDQGVAEVLGVVQAWIAQNDPNARIEAPPARRRGGYYLPPDHPQVLRLERLLADQGLGSGVFGEYGGTDASSLA